MSASTRNMTSFGDRVASLLDTYTKCLSLLKRTSPDERGSSKDGRRGLNKSIQSQRARIRRYYSSKLASDGARFRRGDAKARGSLKTLVRRIVAAMEWLGIMTSKERRHPLDYESLLSLVDDSGTRAIRTMSDLSSRVGSRRGHGSGRSPGRSSSSRGSLSSGSDRRSSSMRRRQRGGTTNVGDWAENMKTQRKSREGGRRSSEARVSLLTTSSGSTKLGEIRRTDSQHREPRAIYPLMRSFSPSRHVPTRRGRWFTWLKKG